MYHGFWKSPAHIGEESPNGLSFVASPVVAHHCFCWGPKVQEPMEDKLNNFEGLLYAVSAQKSKIKDKFMRKFILKGL